MKSPRVTATSLQVHQIFLKLNEVYDTEKQCFISGHSDISVAADIGVKSSAVQRIRQRNFGPAKQAAKSQRSTLKTLEQLLYEMNERLQVVEKKLLNTPGETA